MKTMFTIVLLISSLYAVAITQELPGGAKPLTMTGDIAAQMVAGIDRYYTRMTVDVAKIRKDRWHRDASSPEAYDRSILPNRDHLRRILGLTDKRLAPHLESITHIPASTKLPSRIHRVRWNVLPGVDGEGLLLIPDGAIRADVIVMPDCDESPEQSAGILPGLPANRQVARILAESGCRVLVPTLIDRNNTWSGHPAVRFTNLPHREFIWRAAYQMGRTPIGYEVQKVMAAVDWFTVGAERTGKRRQIGIYGEGEGGAIALYAAALDTRIDVAFVSGYFQPRQELWSEPIYRNLFGLLEEFGDAEIASLIAPRALIVEAANYPVVSGPPPARDGHSDAASGKLVAPNLELVRSEFDRTIDFIKPLKTVSDFKFATANDPNPNAAMASLLKSLGARPLKPTQIARYVNGELEQKLLTTEIGTRMHRQFDQIMAHTQSLMRESPFRRAEYWAKADATSIDKWKESTKAYRDTFWNDIIGKLPAPDLPPNPKARLIYDQPKYRGYEVTLDLYPDVFAYGILLVPKNIKPGEKRAVVVCQHGLEGRPTDAANPDFDSPYYHKFACKLAEEGFVTFSPQNPYIGEDHFRILLRKSQPLHKTLFSVIARQHERILDWLAVLPYVNAKRIAFYGLSYGGKTAMRMPAILDRYCLSICSADYNEWILKNVDISSRYCYLYTTEYDMPEWNLGNTFNYAEMSWLICPRPFMVERGHLDGVAPDEWVAHEYARTRQRYDLMGLADHTELEVFTGPHTIHGVGTFEFLRKHLK